MVLRPIRASGGRTGASVCSGDCGLCCKERIEKVQGSRFGRVESLFFRPFGAVFAIFNSTHGSRRGLHSFAASRLLLLPAPPALGCIPSLLRGFYCSNRSRPLSLQSKDDWPLKSQLAARFLQKPEGNRDGQRMSVRGRASWSSCWAAQAFNGDAGAGACTRVSLGANSSEEAKWVPMPVAISAEDAIH
jgi:hypothetical protein